MTGIKGCVANDGIRWVLLVWQSMTHMIGLQAADEAILVLAPMLLLMNQDPLVFRSLTDRRRYAPLVLGLTACLTFSAVTGALQKAGTAAERSPFVVEQRQPSGMWLLIKNLALLALALPNHILFLRVRLLLIFPCGETMDIYFSAASLWILCCLLGGSQALATFSVVQGCYRQHAVAPH